MSRFRVLRSLVLASFLQHPGRLALSVLAIALGVALGYAVQLINQAAINEFAAAVQTLSGEADLAVRGPGVGLHGFVAPASREAARSGGGEPRARSGGAAPRAPRAPQDPGARP